MNRFVLGTKEEILTCIGLAVALHEDRIELKIENTVIK